MGHTTRYTRSGALHIAYNVAGEASEDIVYVPTWIGQIEVLAEEPTIAAFLGRMCTFARLISFDRRGAGLSDPWLGFPTLEDQMDDVLAVMDAAGSERATLMGSLEGGPLAMLFAATHPDRVSGLILYATFARSRWAPDYDWPPSDEERRLRVEAAIEQWGSGGVPAGLAPSRMGDPAFVEWAGRMERYSASPGVISQIMEAMGHTDVRPVLPTINVPTLVMHRTQDPFLMVEHGRYLGEHIPGARYVELEGTDSLFSVGDSDAILGEIEEFVTGTRHEREPDRVLATVLFTDIVRSTERAAELGDRAWREVLERHDRLVRQALTRHRGRAVKSTGDGVLATFDGPARAIRAAASIGEGAEGLGIQIRAGLHTGECEVIGDDVGGMAVHIGARVMSTATAGEVLVSSTVKDLVVGSGIDFEERGAHELRGVPGEWRLFAARP
ncbi:MAG TPA: adenylate/guanylate cyclase domain-containing protein [Thermoleophilaceae bacterium]|nr:adenylate/guanylate cyclase domain-containing protein [Thermoleophilaceae bacterium]